MITQENSYVHLRTVVPTPRNGFDVGVLAVRVDAFGLEREKAGAGLQSVRLRKGQPATGPSNTSLTLDCSGSFLNCKTTKSISEGRAISGHVVHLEQHNVRDCHFGFAIAEMSGWRIEG